MATTASAVRSFGGWNIDVGGWRNRLCGRGSCVVGAVLILAGIAAIVYASATEVVDAWQKDKVSFYNGEFMDDRYFGYFVVDSLSGANNAGCQVSPHAEKFPITEVKTEFGWS